MTIKLSVAMLVCILFAILWQPSFGCTNYIVTKSASTDGSTHFSYAADSGQLYGTLGHYPAADHEQGDMRDIYDWDDGFFRGQIPEPAHTYNVIGNINEFQVAIGETTFGGRLEGNEEAIMDYGSLMWVTLQRSKTARHAIKTMTDLVEEFGYGSEGESFTIGDPNEVWVLEMISKGPKQFGAVWAAVKIPDGYVSGHSNQARIRQFPLNDPEAALYSADVIDFAIEQGWYSKFAPREDFSFSDTYDPLTMSGARLSEGRTWNFLRQVAEDTSFGARYLDYIQGRNLTNRMPLYVKPGRKISVQDTMNFMRSHFEGTYFDMTQDVGAGAFNAAFRVRPLVWEYENNVYVNERSPGTQQTGWHFVAQLRSYLPNPIGGLLWFGVDDVSQSVHTPIYCGTTRVPASWADGNGDAVTFSFNSAFWVFNMVSNLVYSRYSVIYPEVLAKINELQAAYQTEVAQQDKIALTQLQIDPNFDVVEYLTEFSVTSADDLVQEWLQFWQYLFTKYRDGFIVTAPKNPPNHGGAQGGMVPDCAEPGYPNATWYKRIVDETGDHFLSAPDIVPDLLISTSKVSDHALTYADRLALEEKKQKILRRY